MLAAERVGNYEGNKMTPYLRETHVRCHCGGLMSARETPSGSNGPPHAWHNQNPNVRVLKWPDLTAQLEKTALPQPPETGHPMLCGCEACR